MTRCKYCKVYNVENYGTCPRCGAPLAPHYHPQKVVINNCFGGFSVSEAVYNEIGILWDGYGFISNEDLGIVSDNYYAFRADERLVKAVEKLGAKAGNKYSQLEVVEVPEGVDWEIEEYDGAEWVSEKHSTWR